MNAKTIYTRAESCYELIGSKESVKGENFFTKGYDRILGREVGIKRIKLDNCTDTALKSSIKHYKRQVRLLVDLERLKLNIPRIYNTFLLKEGNSVFYYIVMEYISGKPFDPKKIKSERVFLKHLIKLVDILIELQKRKVNHKDIKPENIIISKNARGSEELYLIDFDISSDKPNSLQGTPGYKSPEMSEYTFTHSRQFSDMFSIGVLMYTFYTKVKPKEGREYDSDKYLENKGKEWTKFTEPIELNPDISPLVNEIIKKLMNYDPYNRFSNLYELKDKLYELLKNEQ